MTLDRIDHLFSALLRSDKETGKLALADGVDVVLAGKIYECLLTSGLPNLLSRRLYELGLSSSFQNVSLPSGRSFLVELNKSLAYIAARYMQMDESLIALLSGMDEAAGSIVLLKGAALSRYLYEEPSDRISLDFDLLIEPAHLRRVFNQLVKQGFSPVWNDPGHCHQYLSGPTGRPEDLFVVPSAELIPYNITMLKEDWPMLELKCDPLDRGLRFHEMHRFISETREIRHCGQKLRVPSDIDHLMLQLTHFHKHGLVGWAWLYDIHLLSSVIAKINGGWGEFVRRCQVEGIESSAWLGLNKAILLLKSPVPDSVMAELKEKSGGPVKRFGALRTNVSFLWNCSNGLELIANTIFLGDSKRKIEILLSCLFPTDEFIRAYYFQSAAVSRVKILAARLINFLVLIFPAGLTRRSFGPIIWGSANQKRPVDDC